MQLRITPLNRPVQRWRDAPITPEMRAASEVYQKERAALRAKFESEWVPPPGYDAERDLEEMQNIESAAFTVWEERRKGRIAAASTPVWENTLEYWLIDGPKTENDGLLAKQPTAASLTLPILLKGGGDMKVTFETKKVHDMGGHDPAIRTWMEDKLRLVVRTEHGLFAGHLKHRCSERGWYVVSLSADTPQEVAGRVARTLDAIEGLSLPDDYLAFMPVSSRCSICSRPLNDFVSKTLGIGPDCAGKLGLAHSAAFADAVIAKRAAFLAEAAD
ncbi:DUF6011 domain-containing protein [Bradyrhizobium iriomotense]|uniref:DUF6011 domain-containing protein n=1 Tax=Bradyrhizobium iriomotense TaxID=441950 RepID=UPI001B89E0AB|nr:DUF6011 domain-containing protein [Bradyrhizobium iriomotense]MBR0787391.1 hypothetical protein [Bradyrhizobium iriomotense]